MPFFWGGVLCIIRFCDRCIFLCPCVRDKQDIQNSENLNRKRQGDKQTIPVASFTGTTSHRLPSFNGLKFHM